MRLKDLPIRRKLTLITMISSTVALMLACAAFVVHDVVTSREQMVKDWCAHADIVGNNSTAALSFERPEDAAGNLRSLGVEPHLTDAAIYDAEGNLFAAFCRGEGRGAIPMRPTRRPAPGHAFRNGHLELVRPVLLDGKRVGMIYVRSDLKVLYARVARYAVITGVVLFSSASVAYGLVVWLQRVITNPVAHLAATARTISADKNYAVRAVKDGNDELGVLIDCFNDMLLQIQQRDAELTLHRETLEEQVQRRTEELRTVNAQLVVEKDRAEEASRAKSAFLANMSHEIRTPMTAILGYTEMMLEDPGRTSGVLGNPACTCGAPIVRTSGAPGETPDAFHQLQTIRRNARHLMDLINDILDISKIEAGKMTVERLRCDLPQLVGEVVSLMRPRATEKGLRLEATLRTPVPRWIESDPLRLRQILVNLVGNAVKFTAGGGSVGIEISCERRPGGGGAEGNQLVSFAIQDSGIGIEPEQLGKLFQPFTQADSSTTRRFGGTGLGLAISQRLATLLGGDITARSTPGAGSRFVLTIDGGVSSENEFVRELSALLPVRSTHDVAGVHVAPPSSWSSSSAQAGGAPRLSGRILLAEDGPDNQVLISTYLRKAGAEVVIVPDGRAAVDAVASEPFDLLVMDMQMPVLDGYGATAELRGRGYAMPIVALTAHALSGDREKCIRAGCTDYLTKPIDKLRLLSTIQHYLVQAKSGSAPVAVAATASPSPSVAIAAGDAAPSVPKSSPGAAQPEVLVSGFKDDPDLMEVLGKFVGTLPERVQKLGELLARNDMAELGRLVHQMKGASGGYGFPILSKIAAKAEQRIKAKEPLEAVAADVNELIGMIRRVEGYVEPAHREGRTPPSSVPPRSAAA